MELHQAHYASTLRLAATGKGDGVRFSKGTQRLLLSRAERVKTKEPSSQQSDTVHEKSFLSLSQSKLACHTLTKTAPDKGVALGTPTTLHIAAVPRYCAAVAVCFGGGEGACTTPPPPECIAMPWRTGSPPLPCGPGDRGCCANDGWRCGVNTACCCCGADMALVCTCRSCGSACGWDEGRVLPGKGPDSWCPSRMG